MGNCAGQNVRDPNDKGRGHDRSVQRELDEEKTEFGKRHKLLLLGPGNSGKSTFFKQLCTIHGDGLPEAMLRLARHNVYDCCIQQAKNLISLWHDNMQQMPGRMLDSQNNPNAANASGGYNNMNNPSGGAAQAAGAAGNDAEASRTETTVDGANIGPDGEDAGRGRKISRVRGKNEYIDVPDEEELLSEDEVNLAQRAGAQAAQASGENSGMNGMSAMNSNTGAGGETRAQTNKNNNSNNNIIQRQGRQMKGKYGNDFDFSIDDAAVLESIDFIENDLVIVSNARFEVNSEIAEHIARIWSHEAMKKTYEERSNLTLVDSAAYFFDHIDRVASAQYEPTEEDILLVRNASTGIREQHFWIEGNLFYLYDVGGQRSERKKWIKCFDSVDAVLFVAALSCYDQMLFEESETLAMIEAIRLFEEVVNSRYFRQTSMIIFFNKADLFRERIERKPLSVCFPDYKGPDGDFDAAVEYIRRVFLERNVMPKKEIYCHVTIATDKTNVTRIFNDVQHSVVLHALRRNGIL